MPSFGHLFYAFCLLIPLFYFTKDKFSYKIAFVFLMNNLYGPDMVALFFVTPFHNILGFIVLAIPYALIFSYGSRFSIVRTEKGFPLKFEDSGRRELNWKNAFFVVVAGGLSHFFIDQFYHWEMEMNIFDSLWGSFQLPHLDMLAWSGPLYHVYTPIRLIGEILLVVTIILSLYSFKKGWKETYKLFVVASGITLAVLIFEPLFFEGERELALMFQLAIYIFLPLFLLLAAARDVQDNPIEKPEIPKRERSKFLNKAAIVFIAFALFMVIFSVVAIAMSDFVASLLEDSPGPDLINAVIVMGCFYATVSVILLIGSIGLLFRNNICRYLAIAASLRYEKLLKISVLPKFKLEI